MMMMAGLNIQAAKLTLTACPHSCPFQQAFGTQLLPKGDLGGSRVRTTEALLNSHIFVIVLAAPSQHAQLTEGTTAARQVTGRLEDQDTSQVRGTSCNPQ